MAKAVQKGKGSGKKKKQLGSRMQKAKKKWFIVNAPEAFNKKEIGTIPANDSNSLIGRTLEVSFGELTGNRKDVFNKVKLKINQVRGETAETIVKKFYVAESYIQTIHRKNKKRIVYVFEVKTKDEQKLRIKLYLLAKERIHRSVSASLIKRAESLVSKEVSKKVAADILSVEGPKKLSNMLRNELKEIYPVKPVIWKIYNLSA